MTIETDLDRFVEAQEDEYDIARAEIAAGKKRSHWMWFIYPQLRGIGHSHRSWFFGIADLDEATRYLAHPVLGPRLTEMADLLMTHRGTDPAEIMGTIDAQKLRSCVTLFRAVPDAPAIFDEVLDAFFDRPCPRTEARL